MALSSHQGTCQGVSNLTRPHRPPVMAVTVRPPSILLLFINAYNNVHSRHHRHGPVLAGLAPDRPQAQSRSFRPSQKLPFLSFTCDCQAQEVAL